MRKNGLALLESFTNGPMLLAPEFVGHLRSLATAYPDNGVLASLVATIAGGMGLPVARVREDIFNSHDQLCGSFGMGPSDRTKPFAFAQGMAIIPVTGALVHRDNYSDAYGTGYDFIASRFSMALADPDVQGIVFDVNSGGGHVRGNFELCDMIYASRSVKPTLALVDGGAYSGGYSIGSSASKMSLTQSSGAGSIGVLMMHASVEDLLAKHGIDITLLHAGAHKVDGNPFQKLPQDVQTRFQASIDKSYEKFVSLVARNRGLDAAAVRATEAACFDAEEALALNLIDAIQTPADALAAFRQELQGSNTLALSGANNMSNATAPGAAAVVAAPAVVEPAAAAPAAAPAVVAAPAALDEKARIKSITTCDEAKGRETLANHFAFDTDMSVDAARAALAAAPSTVAPAAATGATPFAAAMDGTPNPNVGAGGEAGKEISKGDRMAEAWAQTTGSKLRERR